MRKTFPGGCASVLTEKVSSAVVTKIKNQPTFFNRTSVVRALFDTDRAAEKSAIAASLKRDSSRRKELISMQD